MIRGNYKGKEYKLRVENHDTAAWANIERAKDISNVNIPSEMQVENAKEHVEKNQK